MNRCAIGDVKGKLASSGRQYLLNLAALLMAYGSFYRCRLANPDAMWGEIDPNANLISKLRNYRWLGWAADSFSYKVLHYFPYEHRVMSLVLFLAVLALTLLFLQKTFEDILQVSEMGWRGKLAFWTLTLLCVINVLSVEMFYFTEAFLTFKLSLLLVGVGCWCYSRGRYGAGTLLLVMSALFYQVSCVYAALILGTLAYLQERKSSGPSERLSVKWLRRELGYLSGAAAGGVIDYATGPWLLQRVSNALGYELDPGKVMAWSSMSDNISSLCRQFKNLYESSLSLMMPLYLPLLFSVLLTGICILLLRRQGGDIAGYLLYKLAAFLVMGGLEIISPMGGFTPRVMAPFYCMQAMNGLMALFLLKESGLSLAEWSVPLKKAVGTAAVGYLAVQYFFLQLIMANRVLSENLDILYAERVLEIVDEYEESTGIEVKSAAFCVDESWNPFYEQVKYGRSAINSRVSGLATYTLIETVGAWSGRSFERGTMSQDVYDEYFAGKNWNKFDEEQVVIVGDALYWCVF